MEKRKVVDGLVSIIMPSWNTERFIAETIQSVIDQTYQNWELLIVHDCSTDNTDEVVASFKEATTASVLSVEQSSTMRSSQF